MDKQYGIGRFIGGVVLNPFEFVLDDSTGEPMLFDTIDKAWDFMKHHKIQEWSYVIDMETNEMVKGGGNYALTV